MAFELMTFLLMTFVQKVLFFICVLITRQLTVLAGLNHHLLLQKFSMTELPFAAEKSTIAVGNKIKQSDPKTESRRKLYFSLCKRQSVQFDRLSELTFLTESATYSQRTGTLEGSHALAAVQTARIAKS